MNLATDPDMVDGIILRSPGWAVETTWRAILADSGDKGLTTWTGERSRLEAVPTGTATGRGGSGIRRGAGRGRRRPCG